MRILKKISLIVKYFYFKISCFKKRKYLKVKIIDNKLYFIKNKNTNSFNKLCQLFLLRYYNEKLNINCFVKNNYSYMPYMKIIPKKIFEKNKIFFIKKCLNIIKKNIFLNDDFCLHYFDDAYFNIFVYKYHTYILDIENFFLSSKKYPLYHLLPYKYFTYINKKKFYDKIDKKNIRNFLNYDLYCISSNKRKVLFYKLYTKKYNILTFKNIFSRNIIKIINFNKKNLYLQICFYSSNKNFKKIIFNNYKNFIFKNDKYYFYFRTFNLSDKYITDILSLYNLINNIIDN